ncbi:class I SAM-dependent methyltransferase [Stappia sp. MMSF_3263]|uniref:class I SAM-dependent methyltransferase n=1 Tax=Stappia sp. MMSF_3263 TaxID=3046693 RepID=UPI00273F7E51|nr:class I SAM-dependent methyltransferase [Stappia sp. MMSF_3263]
MNSAAESRKDLPSGAVGESLVTANRRGRTTTRLNEINARFAQLAGEARLPVLDLGCAFGVAAHAALAAGATVIANDIDPLHLEETARNAPPGTSDRLRLAPGAFPAGLDFDDGSLALVHASNLLNFLKGEEIDAGFASIFRWLAPGGRFLSMSGSPYSANIRGFIPAYEANVAAGLDWPGECHDLHARSDDPTIAELPDFLHLLDPAVLSRSAREAGLEVEEAQFFNRAGTPDYIALDGRENVVFVARKPLL